MVNVDILRTNIYWSKEASGCVNFRMLVDWSSVLWLRTRIELELQFKVKNPTGDPTCPTKVRYTKRVILKRYNVSSNSNKTWWIWWTWLTLYRSFHPCWTMGHQKKRKHWTHSGNDELLDSFKYDINAATNAKTKSTSTPYDSNAINSTKYQQCTPTFVWYIGRIPITNW